MCAACKRLRDSRLTTVSLNPYRIWISLDFFRPVSPVICAHSLCLLFNVQANWYPTYSMMYLISSFCRQTDNMDWSVVEKLSDLQIILELVHTHKSPKFFPWGLYCSLWKRNITRHKRNQTWLNEGHSAWLDSQWQAHMKNRRSFCRTRCKTQR